MKKLSTVLIILTFFSPLPAFASTAFQWSIGTNGGTVTSSGTHSIPNPGRQTGDSGNIGLAPIPFGGTASSLYAHTSQVLPAATQMVVTIVDAGATALTCTITAGNQDCNDTTHSFTFSAGDNIGENHAITGTITSGTDLYVAVKMVPTTDDDTWILETNNPFTDSVSEVYNQPGTGPAASSQTESQRQTISPGVGTIKNFYAQLSGGPGASSSYDLYVRQNTSTTTLTCNIAGASTLSCSDTTHTVTAAATDVFSFAMVPNSVSSAKGPGFGIDFVPSTTNTFPFFGVWTGNDTSATRYCSFGGGCNPNATEARVQMASNAITVTAMQVNLSTVMALSKSRIFTLRKNAADTTMTCTVGAGATQCSATGSVSIAAGDLIDFSDTPSPTSSTVTLGSVRFTANFPASVAAPVTARFTILGGFLRILGGFLRIQ